MKNPKEVLFETIRTSECAFVNNLTINETNELVEELDQALKVNNIYKIRLET